jgi:Tfp pilus assembly protein PilN
MNNQNIIEPKNLPLWTAAGFIVALVALIIAITGLYRSSAATIINQAHILLLNQKIEDLTQKLAKELISNNHSNK